MTPLMRAFAQLDDPVFLGVLLRSVAWTALAFALLLGALMLLVHQGAALQGWRAWGADLLGTIGAALLAFWLFVPIAAAIGTLYIDRVAAAVERRWYPATPQGRPATIAAQIADAIAIGLRLLLLNLLALPLLFLLPGIGLLIAWAIAAWAIGRGLFVAVAMRRMGRAAAEAAYRRRRAAVLAQGGILALAGYLPALNLLVPVLGTAAMVHLLDGTD